MCVHLCSLREQITQAKDAAERLKLHRIALSDQTMPAVAAP